MQEQPQHIFLGSYSKDKQSPALYDLNPEKLIIHKIGGQFFNPSFLLCKNKLIYVVEENQNSALSVINEQYQLIKTIPTQGKDGCHITIDPTSTYLSVTNYTSGSFIVYKLQNNIPKQVFDFKEHQGSSTSIHPERQESPHPHSSVFSEDGKVLFVADLGTDIVYYYEVKEDKLQLREDKSIKMTGTGPRHLAHGKDKILYLSCELDSTIRVLSYQSGQLELKKAYKVSENPQNYLSEIKFKDNKVYAASRGDNFMIVFDVQQGEIGLVEKLRFKVGNWPRHFNVSNSGIVYVACQLENRVERFKWQDESTLVQLSGFEVHAPSCVNYE